MGNLAALGVSTSIISTARGPLTLRGLSLTDLKYLVSKHAEQIGPLLAGLPVKGEDETIEHYFSRDDVKSVLGIDMVFSMLELAPALCGTIIACGSDDRGDVESEEIAMNLPLGLQTTAIVEIAKLTFEDGGGAKKVFETVARMIPKGRVPEASAA